LIYRRILLVKTSSMGDVVHNFPVVSDMSVHFPQAEIDWVVEEAFAPIVRLHAMVQQIIPVSIRRWRRSLFVRSTWREVADFRRKVQARSYDAVVDTQGLFKSALLAACAPGRKFGMDWASSREPIGWLYDRAISIPWDRHAVERNRALAAQALEYPLAGPANYAINVPPRAQQALGKLLPPSHLNALKRAYAVLLHSTSAAEKEWPQASWADLGSTLASRGMQILIPYGTTDEEARSERLANQIPGSLVPPRLPLDALSALLGGAALVIGVDTGLSHLAAALGRPTVGIYCASDPGATGLYAAARAINVGRHGKRATVAEVLEAASKLLHG
jgi:heptosyltransferase I